MELLENQKANNTRRVEDVQKAHNRLICARENFRKQYGIYPPVMHVGRELYEAAFPVKHDFGRYPAQAIDSTLVVPKDFCGPWGLSIPKAPGVMRKSA